VTESKEVPCRIKVAYAEGGSLWWRILGELNALLDVAF